MKLLKIVQFSFYSFIFLTKTYGQTKIENDTTLAAKYYNKGNTLLYNDQYDSTNYYFTRAAELFSQAQHTKRQIECINKLAESLLKKGEYKSSMDKSNQVLRIINQKKEFESIKAIALLNIGLINADLGEFDSAHFYLNNAGKILVKENKDLWNLSKLYSTLGIIYTNQGTFDLAIENLNLGLSILEKIVGPNDPKLAVFYGNLGIAYNSVRNFEASIEMNKKGSDLIKLNYGNEHPFAHYFLNNLGLNFFEMGLNNQALEYLNNAIELLNETTNFEILGSYYANLSDVHRSLKNYNLALSYNEKAENYFIRVFGLKHFHIAQIKGNRAEIYFDQAKYDEALKLKRVSTNILEEKLGMDHPKTILGRVSIAILTAKLGDFETGVSLLEKEVGHTKRLFGDKNVWSVEFQYELGKLFQEKQAFKKARYHFQRSLISNVNKFENMMETENPSIEQSLHPILLLKTLNSKATSILNDSEINSQIEMLKVALSIYSSCDRLVYQLRQNFLNYEDKLALAETASSLYEGGIKTSMILYQKTKETYYLDQIMQFMDSNKGVMLSESINIRKAAKTGLLPQPLIKMERENLIQQSYYKSKINQEPDNSEELNRLKKELFTLKHAHDSLILVFQNNHPLYYQLRYQNSKISIAELQKNLPDQTASIEYFEGDSSIYLLAITKQTTFQTEIQKKSIINNQIELFRDVVNLWKSGNQKEEAFHDFVNLSNSIFQRCVKKTLEVINKEGDIQNLVVIPDGKLYYIPFELLIEKENEMITGDYRSLNYLIKDYSISYGYSNSLVFKSNKLNNSNKNKNNYLGIAPTYSTMSMNSGVNEVKEPDTFNNLIWSSQEIKNIASIVDGDVEINETATESRFKDQISKYKVIHLAMHASIDDNDPMNSKLLFSQNEDNSSEDGLLYTYELLNLEINSDLTVLSACNTGFGKLEKGEGIRSLAYGFSAAGSASTVMSSWSIDDQSTSILMQSFFRNLVAGHGKSEALRQAKIDMIKNSNMAYANPYYWGGFLLFGDSKAVSFSNSNTTFIALFLAAICLLLGAYYYWTIRKSRFKKYQ